MSRYTNILFEFNKDKGQNHLLAEDLEEIRSKIFLIINHYKSYKFDPEDFRSNGVYSSIVEAGINIKKAIEAIGD